MFIPDGCKSLKDSPVPQIRLGLQGYGGTGKTWSALTFPNPMVLNIDNGLGAHAGREDVIDVAIYDEDYCKKIFGNKFTKHNRRDVVDLWIDKIAPKIEKGQTLIIDGNTGLQNAYHLWYSVNVVVGQGGKVNDFAEWKLKQVFFGGIFEAIKTLQCDVVFLFHESEKKEKSGEYLGKIRPLMTGAMGDELLGHFTDFFRQHSGNKPKEMSPEKLALWGMTPNDFSIMAGNFKGNNIYYWQTEGDDMFDAKRSSLVDAPRFIPADYKSFLKYRRKETPNPLAFDPNLST